MGPGKLCYGTGFVMILTAAYAFAFENCEFVMCSLYKILGILKQDRHQVPGSVEKHVMSLLFTDSPKKHSRGGPPAPPHSCVDPLYLDAV